MQHVIKESLSSSDQAIVKQSIESHVERFELRLRPKAFLFLFLVVNENNGIKNGKHE